MPGHPEEMQQRTYSQTEAFKIRRGVLFLAVPSKIVLPKDWLVIFDTTLDRTNPVVLATLVHGFGVSVQTSRRGETFGTFATVVARSAAAFGAAGLCNRDRGRVLTLIVIPRMCRVWDGRIRHLVGVEVIIA